MTPPIDFEEIKTAALRTARSLLPILIPGGKFRSLEYVVRNPRRNDRNPGSFKINYKTGVWKDFAVEDVGGGDLISLVAYIDGVSQSDAARKLADKLGISTPKAASSWPDSRPHSHADGATKPAPNLYRWGDEGPPVRHNEIRRHFYLADPANPSSVRVKVKIKSRTDNPKGSWVTYHRVFRDGRPIGWQDRKPDDFCAVPYVTTALNPFDLELKNDMIFWPEGEKDVDTLNDHNLPAFTSGGAGDGLPDNIGQYLKDRRLVILVDNDEPGRKHAEKKATLAHRAVAASIKIIHFPELEDGNDISDFFEKGGTVEQLLKLIEDTPRWSPSPPIEPHVLSETGTQDWRARLVKASDLQAMTFPPARYALPGYIPEGVTIVAGKPKIGKSWLTLDLCIGATADRFTLGHLKPAQGDVLYLALEDSNRRLKHRIGKIWPNAAARWPDRLTLVTDWRRADQGGLDDIEDWCRSVEKPVMIVIDTLEKFRPIQNGKTATYSADYAAVTGLQKIASKYQIAIVINHHLRKMEADDPFDTVSGTLGLTGAADTIIVIKRQAGAVTLYSRGRDIEEKEVALQFERATCRWTILGTASEVYSSSERAAIARALTEAGKEGLSTAEIMAATGSRNRGAIDTLLFKMRQAGEIDRLKRGVYAIRQDSGKISEKERNATQVAENTDTSIDLSNLTNLTAPALERPTNRPVA